MDKDTFIRHYCANYQFLENKLLESSEYVSIEKTNYDTFSSNFIFLFLSICSEIDSLAREYCKILSVDNDLGGIIDIIDKIISNNQPNSNSKLKLRNARVETKPPFEKQHFVPFQKFEMNTSSWWSDHNKIKHNRTEKDGVRYNYQKATLKNVLYAVAALYILIRLIGNEYGFDENNPPISSRLFDDHITM